MGKPEANFQKKFCDWLTDNGFEWIRVKASGNVNKGKPDVAVFWDYGWAWLEFKRSIEAPLRPGQAKNVAWANEHGHGFFVFPENEVSTKDWLLYYKERDGEKPKCD